MATKAPERSAYNRVESRMALSQWKISMLMLPHDHFGYHLDDKGCTVNDNLEISNIEFAGKVLAEVWNMMNIDGHLFHATYVKSGEHELPAEQ